MDLSNLVAIEGLYVNTVWCDPQPGGRAKGCYFFDHEYMYWYCINEQYFASAFRTGPASIAPLKSITLVSLQAPGLAAWRGQALMAPAIIIPASQC